MDHVKECKVVLEHLVFNNGNWTALKNTEINNVSEEMEATPNSRRKQSIRRKRRMTSRVISNRFARGRVRTRIEIKQHKVSQLIDESANDDNTTTSENSESNALYNEIDWEGNVECDTSLVDEFAPRIPLTTGTYTITEDINTLINVSEPPKIEESSEGHEFRPGVDIYVRRHSADIWCAAVVVEVDWDEHEVLIHYKNNSSNIPDEWVQMNSQRLSTTQPTSSDMEENDVKNEQISEEHSSDIKIEVEVEPEHLEKVEIKQEPEDNETDQIDNETVESIIRYHKPAIPRSRQRGGWKRKRTNLPLSNISSRNTKFAVGEQVLAKWSDHRMQNFPAVIKTTYGDGRYDVLFYDGFEKTINEEHLYKTTADVIEKYQKAKPSEADTFVDMDADSKEARRQRKRKTFDDYVFAKEIKMTKRRVLKSGERFRLTKKIGSFAKASESKDGSDFDKPISRKKMRRRRRALFVPKRDNSRAKLHMIDYAHEANVRKQYVDATDNENFYGFDSSQGEENSTEASEPPQDVEEPPAVDVRWKPETELDLKPVNITGNDGLIYKSVVVPDKNLPEGWLKHAVLKPGNVWEIFLLSPDGFQIANEAELKHFGTLPNGGVLPAGLDFQADFSILPKLMNQQNELPIAGTPKLWLGRRSGRGGRRGGRGGHLSSGVGKSIGRVRTLLPKPRVELPSPVVSPPPSLTTPTGSEGEVWKCPKEECDKKFRKESLLQMHIKHYHSELSSLVRRVPNMVDLACARSESVNSDWTPTLDMPKAGQNTLKRILPRPYCLSPTSSTDVIDAETIADSTIPSHQGTSRIPERSISDTLSAKRHNNNERRTTIKTMFPIRTSSDIPTKGNVDSDDAESEDEYIEQKKNGSRIFKPGKYRRNGKSITGSKSDENSGDSSFAQLSTFKLKGRKYSDKLQSSIDNYDSYTEEEKTSPMNEVTEDGVVIERLKSEEFINCACGFREEDGLMIQCDICTCWQHGHCTGIETEADVPERYVCAICRSPFKVRSCKKYAYAQHYLTQGKLPTFSLRSRNDEDISQRELIIKRSFELKSCIHEIRNVDRSLSAKINIIEQPDHPKLYMWAKNWENLEKNVNKSSNGPDENSLDNSNADKGLRGPEPETPIDLDECRLRLLSDIENGYSQLEDRLTSLQTQVAALESLDPDDLSHPASDKALKQSIQVLLRDLTMVKKLATINCQVDAQL